MLDNADSRQFYNNAEAEISKVLELPSTVTHEECRG